MFRHIRAVPRRFAGEESGVSAVEYGVMLALIVVVSIASIATVGRKFADIYDMINAAVPH